MAPEILNEPLLRSEELKVKQCLAIFSSVLLSNAQKFRNKCFRGRKKTKDLKISKEFIEIKELEIPLIACVPKKYMSIASENYSVFQWD